MLHKVCLREKKKKDNHYLFFFFFDFITSQIYSTVPSVGPSVLFQQESDSKPFTLLASRESLISLLVGRIIIQKEYSISTQLKAP